jgi:YidC/Oxa1 family membrane protein insertase
VLWVGGLAPADPEELANGYSALLYSLPVIEAILMPVMMLLWFNSYSSGLTYYYFLANILTIGQTLVIRRMIDDEKIHAVMQANAAKNKNRKKSKFQLRYEELLRQQEEAQRNASRRK